MHKLFIYNFVQQFCINIVLKLPCNHARDTMISSNCRIRSNCKLTASVNLPFLIVECWKSYGFFYLFHIYQQKVHDVEEDDATNCTNLEPGYNPLFTHDEDGVPFIYICATMWHENAEEMFMMMKSLLRFVLSLAKACV